MDQNRDWRPIAALVLAGLALLVALGGSRGYGNDQVSTAPQQIIVQPVAPSTGTTAPVAPVITVPGNQPYATHAWGGWRGGWPIFPLFPLLFFAAVIFLAFRVFGHRRYGWGGPGWYGRMNWHSQEGGGPGPGPQGPPPGQPYGQQ